MSESTNPLMLPDWKPFMDSITPLVRAGRPFYQAPGVDSVVVFLVQKLRKPIWLDAKGNPLVVRPRGCLEYTAVGEELYEWKRQFGRTIRFIVWEARCRYCGEPFRIRTTLAHYRKGRFSGGFFERMNCDAHKGKKAPPDVSGNIPDDFNPMTIQERR